MSRDELRSGAAAGLLAAASTAGALIALGLRTATASRPFNIVASRLLGPAATSTFGFVPRVTFTGVALHVLVTAFLGLLVLLIVRRKLAPLWLVSGGVSALCCLTSIGVAKRGGASLAFLFPIGDLIVFYLVLWLSLVVGIRFALLHVTPKG